MLRIEELADGTLYVSGEITEYKRECDLDPQLLYKLNLLRACDKGRLPTIGWCASDKPPRVFWLYEPGEVSPHDEEQQ